MNKLKNLFNWFGWKSKLILVLLINGVIAYYFLNIGFNLSKKHSISELPNSCFIDSMIYASKCNLLLETSAEVWNSVYGFTFYYKDDVQNMLGHAICIFEYNNNLWMYDPNWGTSPICKIGKKKEYREKIRLYINQYYPIIVVEDFMLNDWTYVQKIKKNKMNKIYKEVSIHLDEDKKE